MKINFKDSKGITLIVLIITIIVMIIIAAISIKFGYQSVYDANDSVIEAGLETVQHAIMQQYAKVNTIEGTGESVDFNNLPTNNTGYIGTIQTPDQIAQLLNDNGVNDSINKFELNRYKTDNDFYKDNTTQENAYYIIQDMDLEKMGIEDTNGKKFLINYATGEVWDLTNVRFDNGTYAYIAGIGTGIEISREDFTDTPINISFKGKITPGSSNQHVAIIKVTDSAATITDGVAPAKNIKTEDFTNGNIEVKINDTKVDDMSGKISVYEIKTVSDSDGTSYEVKVLINKNLFPTNESVLTLIIKDGTIIDDLEFENVETTITTSLDDGTKSGTISYTLGDPEYQTTTNPDGGFVDSDGVEWGISANVPITLSCTSGLLAQDYTFKYSYSSFNPKDFIGTITLRPNYGDKTVSGNIYVDPSTDINTLYVMSSQGYSGIGNTGQLSTNITQKKVNIDKTSPTVQLFVGEEGKRYKSNRFIFEK